MTWARHEKDIPECRKGTLADLDTTSMRREIVFCFESNGDLHLHILMEGMDEMEWLSKRNRKITIRKTTLLSVVQGNYSITDIMLESLAHHMKTYILRLGKGKQSFKAKDVGIMDWRIEYLNKSLDSWDFNGWEHLDVENSDMT